MAKPRNAPLARLPGMSSRNPDKFQLLRFASPEALAEAAARDWLADMATVVRERNRYTVALSGGRIAHRFLAAAAEQARAQGFTFQGVHFFWSDERCVPPDEAESNFALARVCLLQPLGIPESQLHRLRGEQSPGAAAAEAEAELRRLAPSSPEGQPVLDLVFLGLGEEGHVASLFPGESQTATSSSAVFRPVTTPKPPPQRITLGYPALAAARAVWVLASGAGKTGALRESLAPAGQTPLARVLRLRQQTRIYTDIALS
jgi:6-phosphogluconolactonase